MSRMIKTADGDGDKIPLVRDLDMLTVMTELPELTYHGFGIYKPSRCTFEQARAELLSAESLRQFEAAKCWLEKYQPSGYSYTLKHMAEHYIGYIANGVFIAAALAVGYNVRRCSLNAKLSWASHGPLQRGGRGRSPGAAALLPLAAC